MVGKDNRCRCIWLEKERLGSMHEDVLDYLCTVVLRCNLCLLPCTSLLSPCSTISGLASHPKQVLTFRLSLATGRDWEVTYPVDLSCH
jgi:hypothetical protein